MEESVLFEIGLDGEELLLDAGKEVAVGDIALRLRLEMLFGTGDGKPLAVKKIFDLIDLFEVFVLVHAPPGPVLPGPQQLELALPVPKDMGGDAGYLLHLAYAVVELFHKLARCALRQAQDFAHKFIHAPPPTWEFSP